MTSGKWKLGYKDREEGDQGIPGEGIWILESEKELAGFKYSWRKIEAMRRRIIKTEQDGQKWYVAYGALGATRLWREVCAVRSTEFRSIVIFCFKHPINLSYTSQYAASPKCEHRGHRTKPKVHHFLFMNHEHRYLLSIEEDL